MREYKYSAPESLEELFTIIRQGKHDEIRFVAGGTDFVPRLNLELHSIPMERKKSLQMIYIGYLGLDSITEEDGVISIGSCCSLNDIMNHPVIISKLPALSETIREMAGHTIRNTGTIGGNIMNASPAADSVPTLMVLDAEFQLESEKGARTVNASEFFTGPGKTAAKSDEVLTAVRIKSCKGNVSFQKLGRRQAETLSVVNAAAYVELEDGICVNIRVAVGSVAPTVVRCRLFEKELLGKVLTPDIIKEARSKILYEINPIDDIRSSAWYRKRVAPVMVFRAVKTAAGLE